MVVRIGIGENVEGDPSSKIAYVVLEIYSLLLENDPKLVCGDSFGRRGSVCVQQSRGSLVVLTLNNSPFVRTSNHVEPFWHVKKLVSNGRRLYLGSGLTFRTPSMVVRTVSDILDNC